MTTSDPATLFERPVSPDTPIGALVGARLRALRILKDWTQAQLGAEANMAVPEISRIELGRRCPSLFTLACLAVALEVDLSDLLATGQDEPTPQAALKAARKRRKALTMNHMQGFVGVRVGFALKALRTAKGLNQTEAAAFLGVDAGSLSAWESSTRIPHLGRFYGLCAAYGSTPYAALLPSLEDQSYAHGQRSKFRA